MAWLVLLSLLYGDARSRNYLVPGSNLAYLLMPKNHLNIATCWCRWRESNPDCQRSKRPRYPLNHCTSAWELEAKCFHCRRFRFSFGISAFLVFLWSGLFCWWDWIGSDLAPELMKPNGLPLSQLEKCTTSATTTSSLSSTTSLRTLSTSTTTTLSPTNGWLVSSMRRFSATTFDRMAVDLQPISRMTSSTFKATFAERHSPNYISLQLYGCEGFPPI